MNAHARWADALLAALATLTSAWAITGLFATQPWVGPTVLLLGVIVVSGALARALRWPAPAVVATQLVLAGLTLSWLLLPGHHWYGLPRLSALGEAARLTYEAVDTIRTETVPAPAEPGLMLLVVAGMAAVGVAVDALGVTLRSPALAGLPLLAVCTVTASNTGEPLHPQYFLATAAAWLLLVVHHGTGAVRSWAAEAEGDRPTVRAGVRRHRARARALGATTVALAVVLPGMLPHLPPTTVVQGLAQDSTGTSGQVTFVETLNLSEDLTSRSPRPVLRYRSDDPRPAPLRVAVSTRYSEGQWQPHDRDLDATEGPTPPPEALQGEERTMTVLANTLRAPQVAVPHPLLAADFGEIEWGVDPVTGTVLVAEQPQSYDVTYAQVRTAGTLPPGTGARSTADLVEDQPELLEVAPDAQATVAALAQEVTAGSDNQVETAMAIQSYLRSSVFTYSLTLAEPAPGEDPDPISHFLQTRQGYCTQFATAMVMMARASGIPARLAVGFLPGQRGADGSRTVVAADAHAWPELLVDGVGWTRFEPTPGGRSGVAPTYLVDDGADPEETPEDDPTVEAPQAAPTPQDTAGGPGPTAQDDWWDQNGQAVLGVGTAALLLVLSAGILPLAGWWRRRSGLRGAATPAQEVEGHWQWLTTSLADLGLGAPSGATPRQAAEHYRRAAELNRAGTEAITRTSDLVQQARYTQHAVQVGSLAGDAAAVLTQARRSRPWRRRAAALLWPPSGRAQLSSLHRELTGAFRTAASRVRAALPAPRRRKPRPMGSSGPAVPRSSL